VLSRYGISRATLHHEGLLWSTVAINVAGSFALGMLVAAGWFSRDVREGIGVGFLGGFTTFTGTAGAYLIASVVGGIVAATVGYVLGASWRATRSTAAARRPRPGSCRTAPC
jgi:fluoride ion exporter CrcB/FEX